jgi:hypothetical protein
MAQNGKWERKIMIAIERSEGKAEGWVGSEKYRWQIRIQRKKRLLCAFKGYKDIQEMP